MRAVFAIGVMSLLAACGGDSALPKATAVSPDGVRQSGPSYSPDGKRLAWWTPTTDSVAEWQLWVGKADQSAAAKLPVTAVFGGPVLWSPDGTRIATISSQFGLIHIVVVPVAGGAAKRVTQNVGIDIPVAWYPDGDRLAYYASAQGGTFTSFVVSTRTGVSVPSVPSEKHPYLAVPSPDGSHIVFMVSDGPRSTIWLADSAGGNPRQLTTEGFEQFSFPFAAWSPDGKEILYESRRTGTADLWVVPTDGGKARQLTRDVRNDQGGSWSGDGKWVSFISDRGRQTDVWVVPATGGAENRITDNAVEEQPKPMWRPASNALSFVTNFEKSGIWTLDMADGKERRLTPDSIRAGFFNVSPDGKQVLYAIERGGGIQDLAVMPLAGGESRVLVAGGGSVACCGSGVWWSPDGTKIVFSSDRGGTYDIWVVDAAGGAPRQLVNWPGYEGSPVWNADGSAIFFVSDRDARLGDVWKVAAAGGEPTRVTKDGSVGGGIRGRAGVGDIFAGTLNPRGGQLSFSRLSPDGRLQAVWEQTNANVVSISPSGDSVAAAVEQADGKQRSMILAANGHGGRVILKPGEQVGAWSNDGTSLLYKIPVGGTFDLGILRIGDGTTRRLTTTRDDENGAELTSDGKVVVFRRSQTVSRIFSVDLTKMLAGAK